METEKCKTPNEIKSAIFFKLCQAEDDGCRPRTASTWKQVLIPVKGDVSIRKKTQKHVLRSDDGGKKWTNDE